MEHSLVVSPIMRTVLYNVAQRLPGTRIDLQTHCREHGIPFPLDDQEQAYLDLLVVKCPTCGRWADTHAMVTATKCRYCMEGGAQYYV